jgi:flagellar FliJ protein
MAYKFPLQKVMDHRKNLEGMAQREFQEIQFTMNEEIEKLNKMQSDREDAVQRRFQLQENGGNSSSGLQQVHEYLVLQDLRIERQKLHLAEVEKELERRREVLRSKAIDYKIMESLREKKKTQYLFEVSRKEQLFLDEIATVRSRKKKE